MVKEEKIFYASCDRLKLCGVFNFATETKAFALMSHGINMNKNEWNNLHFKISQDLNEHLISTFRFDYRAHGESNGKMRDMTVIGEYIDVKSSVVEIKKKWKNKIAMIASSFGAGSTILYASVYPEKIGCLILLNPVLDYNATFLNPEVEWAKGSFNKKGYQNLEKKGYLLLDGKHQLDAKLIAEFEILKPFEILQTIKCPVLTIHGNEDSMVPYYISKKYGKPNKRSKFLTIKDAEHGFVKFNDEEGKDSDSIINQQIVTKAIIDWIKKWVM
jgi:pimeloyl-ACP methyl ester carboxylesterase